MGVLSAVLKSKARAGDPRAPDLGRTPVLVAVPPFERVYSVHFDFVWRSARGLGFSAAGADDVAQDVFIIVHRKLCDFDPSGSLKSWLFGITRRVCKDHRRSARRRGPQLELDPQREQDQRQGPDEQATQRQALHSLEEFSQSLDEDRRELLFLALIEGLPVVEVAAILNANLNTVYSRVRALRKELAAHLGITEELGVEHG